MKRDKLSALALRHTPTFYGWYCSCCNKLSAPSAQKLTKADNQNSCNYLIWSRLLYECFEYLNRDRHNESLIDISGVKFNDHYSMEQKDVLKHEKQSSVYARSNLQSTFQTLMKIDSYGGLLTGVFHIHPGMGPDSVHPSAVDINDQRRRENIGMKAIGAIFSRDGYIQFFADRIQFSVNITGKGIIDHGNNLYRLERHSSL